MPHDPTNRYLGDGAYASFDGYQIWLAANHHENKVIALEPPVMAELVRYAHSVMPGFEKDPNYGPLVQACEEFCSKVETGQARSVHSYAAMTSALALIGRPRGS